MAVEVSGMRFLRRRRFCSLHRLQSPRITVQSRVWVTLLSLWEGAHLRSPTQLLLHGDAAADMASFHQAPPMGAAGGPSLPGATEQLQPQFVSRFLEGQSGVTIKHVSCGDLFTACLTGELLPPAFAWLSPRPLCMAAGLQMQRDCLGSLLREEPERCTGLG